MRILSNITNICIRRYYKMPLISVEQFDSKLEICDNFKSYEVWKYILWNITFYYK